MKISIITATYNNKKTIADTLYAVSSQTYKNIEHIIIDGKSTDNTLKIIEEQKNDKIKIISEKDNGIYDALNKGIKHATGEVIGFLHSDDIYADNNAIKYVVEKFNTEKTDSLYADLQYVSKNDINKVIRNWKSGKYHIKKLKQGWMPPHPTFFVKNEIYEKHGIFNTNYKIAADYDLMLRFLGKHKITTTYLPLTLIKMRVGGESNKSLKNIIRKMKEDFRAIKNNNIGGIFTLIRKNTSKITQFFKS